MLDRFHHDQQARGWQVVGLAVDNEAPVRKFLAQHPVGFLVGLAGFEGVSLSRALGNAGGGLPYSVVFNANGEQVGLYRKIHLFDITAPDGKTYAESNAVAPGRELFIYEINGYRIGCAICYDLRFSRLFDRLSSEKVDIFVLPAAFTQQTGQAHWEVLCRARAIEFQAYFVACGQCGTYAMPNGERRQTFGHSMVCDPWGQVIAHAENDVAVLGAEIDPVRLREVRRLIPMAEHRVLLSDMAVRVPTGTG
jgi:nitrilase